MLLKPQTVFGPLIFILMVSYFNQAAAQLKAKTKSTIYSDTIHMSNVDSLVGFALLDSVAHNYDIFITGENHTYMNSNSDLWVKTIKYLYTHAGVRNVMIEYGQASGWLINKYLQTGDTALFRILDKYAFKEYSGSYKALMEFNKTLPANDKIRLVGVDLERGVYSAAKVLSILVPLDKTPHDSIDLHIESLLGLATYQDRELFKNDLEEADDGLSDYVSSYSVTSTLDLLMANFLNHRQHYMTLLDTNFDFFEQIVLDLKDLRRWRRMENQSAIQDYVYRETYMFNRFVEDYNKHGGKYFGQFGRCHATKRMAERNACNWYRFKSFANRIQQSPTLGLSDKLFTLGILYKRDNYQNDDWNGIQKHVDSLFTRMDANRMLLYNLKLDTVLGNFFKPDFDMVLLNTTKQSEDHPYATDYTLDDYDYSSDEEVKITYSYGGLDLNLSNLNNAFAKSGSAVFNVPIVFHGLEISTASANNQRIISHVYLGGMQAQKSEISATNITTNAKLKGFVSRSTTFYNFLSNVEFIDIMAGISLGYSRLELIFDRVDLVNEAPILIDGSIGESRITKFSNPALTWGYSGIIDFNIQNFTIGAQYGVQKDLSNQSWRVKRAMSSSPETSLSGSFYTLRLGFNL